MPARDDRRQADGQRDGDDRAHARGDHLAREQRRQQEQRRDPREHEEEARATLLLAELGEQLRRGSGAAVPLYPTMLGI